jgi:predicted ferric reductase
MKKQKILKILNLFLLLTFLLTALALIFYKFIPSEVQGSEILYEAHEISGLIFILLGIFHFILNFNWVKAMYFKKSKKL